jgi:hypothetical protein
VLQPPRFTPSNGLIIPRLTPERKTKKHYFQILLHHSESPWNKLSSSITILCGSIRLRRTPTVSATKPRRPSPGPCNTRRNLRQEIRPTASVKTRFLVAIPRSAPTPGRPARRLRTTTPYTLFHARYISNQQHRNLPIPFGAILRAATEPSPDRRRWLRLHRPTTMNRKDGPALSRPAIARLPQEENPPQFSANDLSGPPNSHRLIRPVSTSLWGALTVRGLHS